MNLPGISLHIHLQTNSKVLPKICTMFLLKTFAAIFSDFFQTFLLAFSMRNFFRILGIPSGIEAIVFP